jgi:DNA sulfur modification protein DndD
LFDQIKAQERAIIEKQVRIEDLSKNRTSIHGKYMMAESEFSRFAEHTLATLESADADERTVKYSHIANDIIQLYRIRLQERKTDILAKTMTDCYHKLANKKNLVNKIIMNPETLDLLYLDSNGEEVAKKRLSAGEKQLMVISLLWALAICSKKKLPVIIDTPLSRLDSSHRQALIKTYFPKASDQTIILSTDSEFDEKYYSMMKDSVGDEFTLQYDDEHKNTSIKNGYFGWGGK